MNKLFLLLLLSLSFLFPQSVLAQEEFITEVNSIYSVSEAGARVEHSILLQNAFTTRYAKSYTFKILNGSPANIEVVSEGKALDFEKTSNDDITQIKIFFTDARVGRGKKRDIDISYTDKDVLSKTGDVWEIFVPKVSDDSNFDSVHLELIVPKSFGTEAFVSPAALEKRETEEKTSYIFDKKSLQKAGVTAAFGKFQVYSFDLTYHIENPINKKTPIEIAIPPDTAFQKVIYDKITPSPDDIQLDADGNWIATYTLTPRERVDIKVLGSVQVFAVPRPFFITNENTLETNLKATDLWQAEDPAVKQIANSLQTPEEVYNYVVDTLTYDFDRVRPNVKRLGAKEALANPHSAICMEFTDAFIALARASGIPAREVNGFAQTDNPELQPLSLVADVLHAWPEYWDEEERAWIQVDPTWGNTTGGIDFFSKLDLKHVTFAIHGASSELPFPAGSYKLGANPQKDVFVNFSKLPEERTPKSSISMSSAKAIPLSTTTYKVVVQNTGSVAIYNKELEIQFDGKLAHTEDIGHLLPFTKKTIVVSVPFGVFGRTSPTSITASFNSKAVNVRTNKQRGAILHLTTILITVIAVTAGSFYSVKRKKR